MESTCHALHQMLGACGDPLGAIAHVGTGHAELEEALLIRIGTAVLAKDPASFPALDVALASATAIELSARARAHVDAAIAWRHGSPDEAAERYCEIVAQTPHDLLALRLAQSSLFFLGRHETLVALIDHIRADWRGPSEGLAFVNAVASFAHAEIGDAECAAVLGRQALALAPHNPFTVHAFAHALIAADAQRDGARWMHEQRWCWTADSRMRTHNAWHLAMFDVEAGNLEAALDLCDRWLLPAAQHSSLDACDAAALLWHLEAYGMSTHGRWRKVSDAFLRTLAPGFWPYVDLHAALAHHASGQHARVVQLTAAIDRCAQAQDFAARRTRDITQPALLALNAWAGGRYDDAAAQFARLHHVLPHAGGSRIQLDIFGRLAQSHGRRSSGGIDRSRAHAHGVLVTQGETK